MSELSISYTDQGGHTVVTARRDGATVSGVMATGSPSADAMRLFADYASGQAARLKADALRAELLASAQRTVFPVLRSDIKAGTDAAREVDRLEAEQITPPASARMTFAANIVEHSRSLKPPAQFAFVEAADMDTAAALVTAGQPISGLTDEAWQALQARARVLFVAARAGLQAMNARTVSIDDLFAHGVDPAAVEVAASRVIKDVADRKASIAMRETHLRSVIAMLAITLDMQPAAVLEAVLAA